MSIADLDARMRAQLRSRYRPLPPAPVLIGEPVMAPPPPPPKPQPQPAEPKVRLIPDAVMARADRLAALATRTAASLAEASDMLGEIEAMIEDARTSMAPEIRHIIRVVSIVSGISVVDLVGGRRDRHMARPRQVVMYLARKNIMSVSLSTIGRSLGHRDHTVVMHGARKIEALIGMGEVDVIDLVRKCETALERRGDHADQV